MACLQAYRHFYDGKESTSFTWLADGWDKSPVAWIADECLREIAVGDPKVGLVFRLGELKLRIVGRISFAQRAYPVMLEGWRARLAAAAFPVTDKLQAVYFTALGGMWKRGMIEAEPGNMISWKDIKPVRQTAAFWRKWVMLENA